MGASSSNVVDLAAERARRAPRPAPVEPEYLTITLMREPGDKRWSFAGVDFESEDYTGFEYAEALIDGWLAISSSEMHVSPADITVSYLIVRKDGTCMAWADPDAVYAPTDIVSSLQDGINEVAASLQPVLVGGVQPR